MYQLAQHYDMQGRTGKRAAAYVESSKCIVLDSEDTSPAKPLAQVCIMYQPVQYRDMQGRTGKRAFAHVKSLELLALDSISSAKPQAQVWNINQQAKHYAGQIWRA